MACAVGRRSRLDPLGQLWVVGRVCVCSLALCNVAGGVRAGVVTVLLLALHPELPKYFPTELTEPIFLFGLFAWLWTLAEWLIGRNESRGLQACSALFLTLTLLSRPVLQLLVPLCLVGVVIAAWYLRRSTRAPHITTARLCRQMAFTLAISLVLPALLVLKTACCSACGAWAPALAQGST